MTTGEDLYRALMRNPADANARLVLADKLDDEAADRHEDTPTPFAAYLRLTRFEASEANMPLLIKAEIGGRSARRRTPPSTSPP